MTSDSNVVRQQLISGELGDETNCLAMSRMNWLWALRPLFESLRQFRHNNMQLHIEKSNFLDALEKVRPTLDLKDPDLVGESGEIVISFTSAWV